MTHDQDLEEKAGYIIRDMGAMRPSRCVAECQAAKLKELREIVMLRWHRNKIRNIPPDETREQTIRRLFKQMGLPPHAYKGELHITDQLRNPTFKGTPQTLSAKKINIDSGIVQT